ncbi:MAG: Asp-tRNA(Asn)/Glu-tRNA(Gln) amidotransferase subunit GatC [Spirochaetes bacterium]|nr:Asp-tRNA(Asn)/Glu-tRNA(Gln) amidotransferase subunit GatC [Spirochaetota bacterium]
MIDDKVLDSVLYMSKLQVSGEEKEKFRKQIEEILSYFKVLTGVDTENVELSAGEGIPIEDLRVDEIKDSFSLAIIKTFAADFQDGYFPVPRILEDASGGEDK